MRNKVLAHLGVDDVDTPSGGCTTHYASLLLYELIRGRGVELIDYPNLVRLNPGVPWKTRGNGGVAIRFIVDSYEDAVDLYEYAVVYLEEYVREYGGLSEHSNASIILFLGEVNDVVKWFGEKALYDIIPLSLLYRVLDKIHGRVKYSVVKGKGRGLIGGLASIGYRMLNTDYTFELLAYRSREYLSFERRVDPESVKRMDQLFGEYTILNYDYDEERPLITPHGPDPILLGIRGEDPDVLVKAYNALLIDEPSPLRVIYRTNQHTDAHLKKIDSLSEAYAYRSVRVRVYVSAKPRRIRGGHLVFRVTDGVDEIDVAVYEPTKRFRDIVEKLDVGDEIEVMGVVRPASSRHGRTINLEKLHVITVKPRIVYENPKCPRCGKRMKSMGRSKGFKCPRCGFRSRELTKIKRVVRRDLEPGWYEPPPSAFKHLMKPIKRFGREKRSFPQIFRPRNFIWVDDRLLA